MKQNVGSNLTDEAAEFARLMETLYSLDQSKTTPAFQVIGKLITIRTDDGDILKAYNFIHRRAVLLKTFVKEVNDEFIDNDLQEATLSAIDRMRTAFVPANFAAPWINVVGSYVQRPDIQSLKFYSRTLRAYRPIIKIQDENISEVTLALADAYVEFREMDGVPEWAHKVVFESMHDLQFCLNNLLICGHDEAIDTILRLHSTVEAVVKEVVKQNPGLGKLEKMAVSFVLLADLFTSAPNVAQALPVWKGWIGGITETAIPQLAPPLKQLEGPKNRNPVPDEA